MLTAADHGFMGQALELAGRGLYTTTPNPRVGCVIVRDGTVVGTATHGLSRPDFPDFFPHISNIDVGFQYFLDTTKYSNGPHDIVVEITDANGNLAIQPTAHVTIKN